MVNVNKYNVKVTFPHDSAISETVFATRYETKDGSIHFIGNKFIKNDYY